MYWSLRTLVRRFLYLARIAEHVFTWVGGENLYALSLSVEQTLPRLLSSRVFRVSPDLTGDHSRLILQ